MSIVRIAAERLLLLLFGLTRAAFLVQALAMGTSLLGVWMASRQAAPPWLEVALRSSLLIGATLAVAGILMVILASRQPAPRVDGDAASSWPWPGMLGLSLVALSAVACVGASNLVPLWREIATLLERIGFWAELQRSGPYSGIVLLPILMALFVPALETAGALFLSAVPLVMLVLLLTRSRRFPQIFAMMVVCQAALVLAGLLAAGVFSRLATEAMAAMAAAEDVEVHRVAERLQAGQGVLRSTAAALVAPMLGHLAWLPFVSSPRRMGAFFGAG